MGSNATYKANFVKVKRFIMIKALKDTMVFPNEGDLKQQIITILPT